MRRHANDPLARGQQRLLEPARDMPAVLDRPHPLLVEASRPTQRGQMPDSSVLISRWPRTRPVPSSTAANACVPLCVSALITIICIVPSFGLTTDEADLGGQLSLGANATLLSGHAEGPRAATGDTTFESQANSRQAVSGSARRQPENQQQRSDVTAQTEEDDDSDNSLVGAVAFARKPALAAPLADAGARRSAQLRLALTRVTPPS